MTCMKQTEASAEFKQAPLIHLPAEAQHVREACRQLLCSSHSLGANLEACTNTWQEEGGTISL